MPFQGALYRSYFFLSYTSCVRPPKKTCGKRCGNVGDNAVESAWINSRRGRGAAKTFYTPRSTTFRPPFPPFLHPQNTPIFTCFSYPREPVEKIWRRLPNPHTLNTYTPRNRLWTLRGITPTSNVDNEMGKDFGKKTSPQFPQTYIINISISSFYPLKQRENVYR